MTRNFDPTRIGEGAACLANSHSSCEPSNYALGNSKATGDLLPQALLAAPKAHVGETKPTVCESEPHRCCHVACMCCLNDLAMGPEIGGLANAVKGNRTTSHVFASCQHPINNNRASAGEATNRHDVCWPGVIEARARARVNSIRCLDAERSNVGMCFCFCYMCRIEMYATRSCRVANRVMLPVPEPWHQIESSELELVLRREDLGSREMETSSSSDAHIRTSMPCKDRSRLKPSLTALTNRIM